ncbi:biosynthetic-type acetolactate synthase large subunit [Aliikangiella coralliicola]|uniref:Acetolactate synthase n=1 Tax=Aliikangiella coralliicola TaxID=2592383 RepID=A0A545UCK3_9GAMM|nr:biosynthetic-type acetolactate synthase large subunit [Aliikangiella coralliicola]TQV87201.1 biosynthetic-type acetolactate synthase large subunit [Aliikangiella coralliicola]
MISTHKQEAVSLQREKLAPKNTTSEKAAFSNVVENVDNQARYSGAELVIKALKDLNVKHIFGYPGGSVLDIYDALSRQNDIQHILVRHEQAATHMADGYSRSTNEVGVVLVTSGPGATNCVTGIATAYMDSIPMVVLSGQVPTNLIGDDAFQETDMLGCSRPIVKHSYSCRNSEEIPATIAKAFHLARSGRPGPVVVDLPKDKLSAAEKHAYHMPKQIKIRSYNPNTKGHPKQIKKVTEALANAKRPVIYAGGGVILSEASELLLELTEKLNAPVASTLMGLGGISGTHQNFVGMLGLHGTYEANKTMANADVILALGARFDDRVTNNTSKFCPDATIIHVDIDPTSISKNIHAHIPVVGSIEIVLEQLLASLNKNGVFESQRQNPQANQSWWEQIQGWRNRACLSYQKSENTIKSQQVIQSIYRASGGEAFVTSDVGQHQMFAALYFPFQRPKQWINSGGLGTMGFGLPAAMGVKLAHPDADVVCITGDGSIQMNIQELSTCLQYNLPVKIILLNNKNLGMVKQLQDINYEGRHSNVYMDSLPDFVALAQAYGHVGIKVTSPDELDAAIDKTLAMKDRLVLLNIEVEEHEHVYPMQKKFGAIDDMWLSKGVDA